MELITLEMAKAHLKRPDVADDDLLRKVEQATDFILKYIARTADATWTDEIAAWTDETVPGRVQAAILYQVGELFRFRGDDSAQDSPKYEHGYPSPIVRLMLSQDRDPVVA